MIDAQQLNELEQFILRRKTESCQLRLNIHTENDDIFGHYVSDLIIDVAGSTKTIPNIIAVGDTNIADYDTPWGRKRRAIGTGTAFVFPIAKHLQSKGINVVVDAPIEGIMMMRDFLQLPYGQMVY